MIIIEAPGQVNHLGFPGPCQRAAHKRSTTLDTVEIIVDERLLSWVAAKNANSVCGTERSVGKTTQLDRAHLDDLFYLDSPPSFGMRYVAFHRES